jgi:acylphosphatase
VDTVRYRVIVHGRVQGVWFRESTRAHADRLGVNGWVRNLHDGSVEVVAEGDEAAVAQLVAWCRTGPPRATVTGIDVHQELVGDERGFVVRR